MRQKITASARGAIGGEHEQLQVREIRRERTHPGRLFRTVHPHTRSLLVGSKGFAMRTRLDCVCLNYGHWVAVVVTNASAVRYLRERWDRVRRSAQHDPSALRCLQRPALPG